MANQDVTDKLFNEAIKNLTSKFGQGYGARGMGKSTPKAIPTGHEDLDSLLTKGASGIYLGGIIEVMGSEGSGKSSLALRTVGNAQKLGCKCCWVDAESGFDPFLASINGCDPEQLVMPDLVDTRVLATDGLSFFNSAEILEMIYKTVISNVFSLVVLDSVAGLMPERVLQEEFDGNQVGVSEVARNMAALLGKIAAACMKTETSVIMINQLRDKPGQYFHDRFHTPGGRALKFFAHQRISVEKINGADGRVTSPDNPKEIIGHYAKITIVKNKKAPPCLDTIEVPIYYREYFPDDAKKCYDIARTLQVIRIRNGVLTWKDGDEVVLQLEGESAMLAKIRGDKMEGRLAAACLAAEDPTKRKIPASIRDLGLKHQVAATATMEQKQTEKPKRK